MSSLEVLQSFLKKQKVLFSTIGSFDYINSHLILFDLDNSKSQLPHHTTIQIHVSLDGPHIFTSIVDEGASNYIISLSCWLDLGSLETIPFLAMLKY